MMKRVDFDRDARDILSEMREGRTEEQYRDLIWATRYPEPAPKPSNGWPYMSQAGIIAPETHKKVAKLR